MKKEMRELREILREYHDLEGARRLLNWDQQTYMPPQGAIARGQQMATLGRLAQEKITSPELGRLLDKLRPYEEGLPYDDDEASLIRVTRREYERLIKEPPSFTAECYAHAAESYAAWVKARPANDFQAVRPYLEKTLELSRRYADFFPGYDHVADPLIALADYGQTVATIRPLFAELREQLVPLVQAVTAQPPADDSCLRRHFPKAEQLVFSRQVIQKFGYDFERGRQDETAHPFMTMFSVNDVRITTRVKEDMLAEALFSSLHEAGHALYQLGVNPAFEVTFLVWGTSSGVHESQSRLWENQVGRSLPFWEHFYPKLQQAFPKALDDVGLAEFYRAVNRVGRSLIRTDADELTYNLHVMIRFDLELALLEGSLAVKDLPEAWHARYEADLGLRAPDDRDGVLQDVHWYDGFIGGAFQGYTLGNIMSALFFAEALKAQPQITAEITQGHFGTLHEWLRANIYQHGSKFTTAELVERVSGEPLTIEPYLAYLRGKFGALYGI